jgi:hypothetical protein
MDERQLERLARRLGSQAADNLDVERVARSVVQRLRTEPAPVVWWRRIPRLQAVAAAAVIVLTAGVVTVSQIVGDRNEIGDLPSLAELQALTTDELEEVFDSLVIDAPVFEYTDYGLHDMNEGQLQELLQRLEG